MSRHFPFLTVSRRSSRRVQSRLTAGPVGLSAEALEDKTLLTVYTVNTTLDEPANGAGVTDGLISLREAINAANSNAAFGDAPAGSGAGTDTITFASTLNNSVITLGGSQLSITDELTINGLGANRLTIDANGQSRVIGISGTTAEIAGLKITGGSVPVGQFGSGIYNSFSSTTLFGLWIDDNFGGSSGAGISSFNGSIEIIGSTISNNSTTRSGGGVELQSNAKIINSTISGNSARDFGGGIAISGSNTLELINSTITGNRGNLGGGANGGGVSLVSGAIVTLYNTIVAGNFNGSGTTSDDVQGTLFNGSQHNLIGDANSSGGLTEGGFQDNLVGVSGSGTRDINTILDTNLKNNGGTVPTHALLQTSVAVNSGDNFLADDQNGNPLVTDGRGAPFTRFGAGTDNANTTVDIGAFELQPRFAVNTLADETTDDTTFSLREAILAANAQNIGSNVGGSTDEILFSSTLNGGTITLTQGQLAISGSTKLSIQGPGADLLAISGNNLSRIFDHTSTSETTISGLTIRNGMLPDNDRGAGVKLFSGNLTLSNLVISDNSAGYGGGVAADYAGTLKISGSTITGNTATSGGGGGIYTRAYTQIINSTISGNSAQDAGGGIVNYLYQTTIINSTITGNRANADGLGGETGGGLWTLNMIPYAASVLQNSIVVGNFVGTGNTADDVNGRQLEFGSNFNLIGNAATAGGLTNGTNGNIVGVNVHDVLDTVLRDNGGPTKTHALIPNSPAINRGNNALAVDASMNPLTNDQRGTGFPRIITRVDIGAFEGFLDPVTSLVGFVNGNWWISYPLANGEYDNSVAANGPASTFQKVLTGDFNGDGHDDLAAWLFNGDWRVGLSDGMGHFTFTTWTTWTVPGIKEIHVGDFNDDGKDDIIGLFPIPGGNRGRWWVGQSNGTQFQNRNWGDFGNFTGVLDVAVGNFDGVKGDDLTIITTTGNIFMVKTSNTRFQYLFSHNWNVNNGFNFFQAGDFNGDSRDDIVAVFGNGANRSVFVAKSTGPATSFASLKFSNLTASQSLDSFLVGDFNGDGKDDVAARLNTTKWWLGLAGVNIFNFTFGTTWSFATNGVNDIHVGSTNGDGNSDILGRDNSGNWYSAESNGTSLTNRVAEMWAPVNWQFVNGGDFQPKATSEELIIPPAPSKQEAEETSTPDIAGRWSGATETTSSAPAATTQAASLLKPVDEEQESSEDYDSFGDASLLDLLYS